MLRNASQLFHAENVLLIAWATGANIGEYAKEFDEAGIIVHHKPIPSWNRFLSLIIYYVNMYKILKSENIDVLHIHRQDLFFPGVVAWIARVRCIKTQHNVFKNRRFTRPIAVLKRLIVRDVFGVVFHTIGESVYQNELNYYKNPSVRINNWYDGMRFFPAQTIDDKLELRKKLSVPDTSFVIVSVGGCSPIKNHCDILRAIAKVKDQIAIYYFHLGVGVQENEEKELAKSLGISEQVRFVGVNDQVREYLVASDLYVMPSKFEGLSISGLEAMACGITPVFYNAPGLRDLVVNGVNGYLIEPCWENLAAIFVQSYNTQNELKDFGLKAKEFVESEFSMNINVPKLIKLYID
jgi:glycosyltransferase involved in cell wall biosynthesis